MEIMFTKKIWDSHVAGVAKRYTPVKTESGYESIKTAGRTNTDINLQPSGLIQHCPCHLLPIT